MTKKISKSKRNLGRILLLITALAWGSSVIVQKHVSAILPPFAFVGFRFLTSFIFLTVYFFFNRFNHKTDNLKIFDLKALMGGGNLWCLPLLSN